MLSGSEGNKKSDVFDNLEFDMGNRLPMRPGIKKIVIISVVSIFLLLVVPALLNILLQEEWPLKRGVIGGDDAPSVWLAFWGTYLAAIGSSAAAIVAIVNEIRNRKRDYYEHQINRLEAEYYRTECEIKELFDIHSLLKMTSIVRSFQADPYAALYEQRALYLKISEVIFLGERYYDQEKKRAFIASLKNINNYYLDLCLDVSEILNHSVDNGEYDYGYNLLCARLSIASNDSRLDHITNQFKKESVALLHTLRLEIRELYVKIQEAL